MNQLKLTVLIIIILLLTIAIGVIKPSLHKRAIIDDADFAFAEEQVIQPPIKAPVQTAAQNPVQNNPPSAKQPPAAAKQPVTPKPEPASRPQKTQTVQKPKPAAPPKAVKQEPPKPSAPHILTEQEEIIVWNKWRSDLQNRIMRDTKIAAPLGTGFKYSFTLDKFGTISNLKVWSTNPTYTESAVRIIKPIILSYQGQPILNFPQGTRRVITNATGGFRMSTSTVYSTPSDYSDVERVKK